MGSWAFMFVSLGFLMVWMWTNAAGFDQFPWQALNLLLSSVAALQATVILISQKRADEVAAALAQHDADVNIESERRIEDLQMKIAWLSETKHEEILRAIQDIVSSREA